MIRKSFFKKIVTLVFVYNHALSSPSSSDQCSLKNSESLENGQVNLIQSRPQLHLCLSLESKRL